MKLSLWSFVFLCGAAGLAMSPAIAANVPCPDLSDAVQVAACPTEEELKFTFTGFCSDNARIYGKDTDVCTDYQRYRQLKNVAMWESRDGEFLAYVSCDLPVKTVKAAKASKLATVRKGSITQLICTYREGIVFTNRTKAECTVDANDRCATDPAACVAKCE